MTFVIGQPAVVVDASVAVELLQGDDGWHHRWSAWAETETMMLTPPNFPFEVANALLRGLGLEPDVAIERLDHLYRTGFEPADRGPAGIMATLRLAGRHGLTVYDAAYLELAIDIDGHLATLDRDLAAAAIAEGIEVVGPG